MNPRTAGHHARATGLACLGAMVLSCSIARAESAPANPSPANANAVAAEGDSAARAVWQRGARIPAKDRTTTEAKLEACVRPIDPEARKHPAAVLARIASEFRVTETELLMERSSLGASWSDLVIAHTLAANAASTLGAARLFKLHDDGLGWSEVAYGLGLDLKQFIAAVRTETRVALGLERADGKAAFIRALSGPPSGIVLGSSVDEGEGAPQSNPIAPPRIKGSGS